MEGEAAALLRKGARGADRLLLTTFPSAQEIGRGRCKDPYCTYILQKKHAGIPGDATKLAVYGQHTGRMASWCALRGARGPAAHEKPTAPVCPAPAAPGLRPAMRALLLLTGRGTEFGASWYGVCEG